MKYLSLLFCLIGFTISAQIPYSQKGALIKEFENGMPSKEQASLFFKTLRPAVLEKSEIDRMPILKPNFKNTGVLEVSAPENMPNPLFKKEE